MPDSQEIRTGYRGAVRAQYMESRFSTFSTTMPLFQTMSYPSYQDFYIPRVEMKYRIGCLGCGAAKWKSDGSCRYCGRQQ